MRSLLAEYHGSPSDAANTPGTNWLRKGRVPSDPASTVGTNWLAGCWRLRNDEELPLSEAGWDCTGAATQRRLLPLANIWGAVMTWVC